MTKLQLLRTDVCKGGEFRPKIFTTPAIRSYGTDVPIAGRPNKKLKLAGYAARPYSRLLAGGISRMAVPLEQSCVAVICF